ncbi:TM2 domain-containing protein [Dysgonomonas termitidis]|uniref:TM2 domain-containing protein n=1 Tax=Dysgonomonas termitidis TaxID=1516126 RepID=A0ABV9KZE7_9BACT
MKNQNTATILALFLGGFGIHKFYLEKEFQGLAYLLFCWTLVPFVLGIIDGIMLGLMYEDTFYEKYNKQIKLCNNQFKNRCVLCTEYLDSANITNIKHNILKDNGVVCDKCLKKINDVNPKIAMGLNNFHLEHIKNLLQKSDLRSTRVAINTVSSNKDYPVKLNKKYKARAFHTGRNCWKTVNNIIAKDENEVRELLDNSEFREPYQIEEIFREPTERQIEFAPYFGIKTPVGASQEDVSALISIQQDDDIPADIGLIEYATEEGFYISRYTGRKALYNLIFFNSSLEDRIAFFIFCVYRWLSVDREINLNKSRHKDLFYEFSYKMQTDREFIKSLNRYQGEDLIWFGTFTHQWNDYSGGSKNTKAYKICALFLKDRLGILSEGNNTINPNIRKIKKELIPDYRYDAFPPIRDTGRNKNYNRSNQGCFNTVALFLLMFFILLIFA